MIKEGKFGVQEAVWLTTITISAKTFFASPGTVANIVGNTGWYMTLISALVALAGFLLIYLLLKRFPGQDLVEIYLSTLGPVFGFALSMSLGLYLLFTAVTRLSEFVEVTRVYVLPLTPNWIISGLFILTVFALSRLGLETIARLATFLIYPLLIGYVFILILGRQVYRFNNIFPLLGNGLGVTIQAGIIRSSAYGEIIILPLFAKSFQGVKYIKREGIISLVLSALIISSAVFFYNLTFPYFIARELTAPMYELAALINYNRFVQRLESIFLFIWIISALISTTAVFYAFIWIFCKCFKIPDKNPIVLSGAVLLYSVGLLHRDIVAIILGNVETIRKFGSVFFFIFPLLALGAAMIKKQGRA